MNNLEMYNMEAIQFLHSLESESVYVVLTDPPDSTTRGGKTSGKCQMEDGMRKEVVINAVHGR